MTWFRKKRPDAPPVQQDVLTDAARTAADAVAATDVEDLPKELLWLFDAPLFIDGQQVDAFYDAVLRPDYEGTTLTLSNSVVKGATVGGQASVGVMPWLSASVSAEASRSRSVGQESTLTPISNSYRHLLALTIHYATRQSARLVLSRADGIAYANGVQIDARWTEDDFIQQSPRAFLMIDLEKGTKLIPAALELDDGTILTVFDKLATELHVHGATAPPAYPGSDAPRAKQHDYWRWFADRYGSGMGGERYALNVLEETVTRGKKIAWIDFQVQLGRGAEPSFMHLHIKPRGQYETGTFAYNFIIRAFEHGMRLVGTLKSEPDLNVLAIFER